MNRVGRLAGAASLALILGASLPGAHAHELYFRDVEGAVGSCELLYGHGPDGQGESHEIPYEPGVVKRAVGVAQDGSILELPLPERYPARFDGSGAALYVLLSTGAWTKTPYGTQNIPRTAAKQPITSWISFESAKRIVLWMETLRQPLSDGLEIVPLENLLSLSEGDKLRVRIVRRGEPVSGAVVAYHDDPRGATGPDGEIGIRLRHGADQRIQASVEIPISSPDAEKEIHMTSLLFRIGGDR